MRFLIISMLMFSMSAYAQEEDSRGRGQNNNNVRTGRKECKFNVEYKMDFVKLHQNLNVQIN